MAGGSWGELQQQVTDTVSCVQQEGENDEVEVQPHTGAVGRMNQQAWICTYELLAKAAAARWLPCTEQPPMQEALLPEWKAVCPRSTCSTQPLICCSLQHPHHHPHTC